MKKPLTPPLAGSSKPNAQATSSRPLKKGARKRPVSVSTFQARSDKATVRATRLNPEATHRPEAHATLQARNLAVGDEALLANALAKHSKSSEARATLTHLAQSDGFRGLGEEERSKLLTLVGGRNEALSAPARAAMATLVRSPAFSLASRSDQTAALREFVRKEAWLPEVVTPNHGGGFDGRRAPFVLEGPTPEAAVNVVSSTLFRAHGYDALRYSLKIDGRTIPLFLPQKTHDRYFYHSAQQVALGLAALPFSSRQLVKAVNVEQDDPNDGLYGRLFGNGNDSYMSAGDQGVVRIYPTNVKATQPFLDTTLIHETGHVLSRQTWGRDLFWSDWKHAMKADAGHASAYARTSMGEDFAETFQLYHQVKGSADEPELRALLGARFTVIDQLLTS